MKIRLSLRLYFTLAMLIMGVSLVSAFSVLTYQYYIEGLENSMSGAMFHAANRTELDANGYAKVLNIVITDTWEHQPEIVKQHMPTPPQEYEKLYKYLEQDNFLTTPEFALLALRVKTQQGEERYVSRGFKRRPNSHREQQVKMRMLLIGAFALIGLLVFLGLLFAVLKTIATPVESLGLWARQLTPARLRQPPPDFRYPELNNLASVVHQSLNSVQATLEREHQFLRHASHELRTPIAVIRNNSELLAKLASPENDKQARVLERIERAGMTMTHLTETLLWLSRDENDILPSSVFQLDESLSAYTEEQRYLLEQKSVEVSLSCSAHRVELPETACRIVLSNLLRNAFQHTQTGTVHIHQEGNQVSILNRDFNQQQSEELGFGLGLALTQRLCKRLGWHYEYGMTDDGYLAKVQFGSNNNIP